MDSVASLAKGPNTVRSALMQTICHHGFLLKQTCSIEETMAYVTMFTNVLKDKYEVSILFDPFIAPKLR